LAGLPEEIGKTLLPTYLPTTLPTSTLIILFSEMLKFPNKNSIFFLGITKNNLLIFFWEGPKENSLCRTENFQI
jgi:hypothetical protein